MDRGVFGKVKLISLDILDFKTLSRGKVTWDYGAGTKFGMINVQHFEGELKRFFLGIFESDSEVRIKWA